MSPDRDAGHAAMHAHPTDIPRRRLKVVGIGMGDPVQLTGEARRALAHVDVVFTLDKGAHAAPLTAIRERLCAAVMPQPYRVVAAPDPPRGRDGDYAAGVEAWHAARAALYEALILREVGAEGCGGFLVWGDPALYDSTLRILDRVRAHGRLALDVEVVPGLSAPQILAARHAIALNRIGGSVLVTTGRRLAAQGFPGEADSVVVMLDGEEAFASLPGQGLEIFWGAYLGTPDEVLLAGPLADTAGRIVAARREERARHGWIMDTYLIRRTD